jgi:hypothetical protein
MKRNDFERMHNAISEALNAAWCLAWDLVIATFAGLVIAAEWLRSQAVVETELEESVFIPWYDQTNLKQELIISDVVQ